MGRIRLRRARWGRTGSKRESYKRIPALEPSPGYPRSIFPILSAQPILPIRVPALDEYVHADNPHELPRSQ